MPSLPHSMNCTVHKIQKIFHSTSMLIQRKHTILVTIPFLFHSRFIWHCKQYILILSWKVLRLEMGNILQMVCLTFLCILWFLPPFLVSSSPDFCGLCGSTENIPAQEWACALYLVMSSVVPLCKLLIFLNYIRDCPSSSCK